ncbi:MAG: amidohydrolase family protein [Acidimicrobiales bacterium]
MLPEWAKIRALPAEEQRRLLADPVVRERLVREGEYGDYPLTVGAAARRPDYERMCVFDDPVSMDPTSMAQLARERLMDPVELIIDLAVRSEYRQLFAEPMPGFDTVELEALLKHPQTVMTFSDAGAHVSQISECSIKTHLLAYWVRRRQALRLEDAVRMVTSVPATAWGLVGRGRIREGWAADVNVFDPAAVAPELPTVVSDLPGGGRRLHQRARGFLATVVAGEILGGGAGTPVPFPARSSAERADSLPSLALPAWVAP